MKKYNAPKMNAAEANLTVTGACGQSYSMGCGKYVEKWQRIFVLKYIYPQMIASEFRAQAVTGACPNPANLPMTGCGNQVIAWF